MDRTLVRESPSTAPLEPAPPAAAAATHEPAAAVLALQRAAGNAAVGRAFETATSGAPSALPHREAMEAAFGQSFAGVVAHVGTPQALNGLAGVGARAAAHGRRVAFASSSPTVGDVAHELAHVVQQGSAEGRPSRLSRPGDEAERAAERAAAAVAAGEPAPSLGSANGATLYRQVNANGGVFNDTVYTAVNAPSNAVGDSLGANIAIDFTANDLVEAPADSIALIQTVRSVTDRAPAGGALHPSRDVSNTAVSTDEDDIGLVTPGGTAIDAPSHIAGQANPNTSPIYFGHAGPTAASPSATSLSDFTPGGWDWPRGSHVRIPFIGAFLPPVPAHMEDTPRRRLAVVGQTFEMTFEVTALVTKGPMENTYLGSVEWGWQSDATGTVTLKPFKLVASGSPTSTFMDAAAQWNLSRFHITTPPIPRWIQDWFNLTVPTVDLPITTLPSGVPAAVDMKTADILTRIPVVKAEIAGLPPGPGVDRTNKEFELRALLTELSTRKIDVFVICNSISDTGSAAVPPEDEVWLALTGGGAPIIALTAIRRFRTGDDHTFEFPVPDFLPLSAPVHVEVNERDRNPRGGSTDDVLVAADWDPPFAPKLFSDPGGHYDVVLDFDK
jgi:uncharacterized protein DUF4157